MQVLAFVPPVAPMIVPTLVIAGDMDAVALLAAIALDIVATMGLIWIAARVYERAILRIGAPVSLRTVFGTGESRPRSRAIRTPRRSAAGIRAGCRSGRSDNPQRVAGRYG